jgi:hypothetical protein
VSGKYKTLFKTQIETKGAGAWLIWYSTSGSNPSTIKIYKK